MSLDFDLIVGGDTVFSCNITHNLTTMADKAGLYACLWRPDENGFVLAKDIIAPLELGLAKLQAAPDEYRKYDAANGWGRYHHFVPFVSDVLAACRAYPEAGIKVSR